MDVVADSPQPGGVVDMLPMWKALRVAVAGVFFILSGGLTAAKRIADWVGRTTFIEDAEALGPKGAKMFEWLADQPAVAFYVIPSFLAAVGLGLLVLPNPLRFRSEKPIGDNPPKGPPENSPTPTSTPDDPLEIHQGAAHDSLLHFVTRHLLPVCDAQITLQDAILAHIHIPEYARHILRRGLWDCDEHRQFAANYITLSGLANSPPDDLSLRQLIIAVGRMEADGYRLFCEQRQSLAKAAGLNYTGDPKTSLLYAEWRDAHDEMVAAYEDIKANTAFNTAKIDPKIPSLWRPMRPSRWGQSEA